MPYPKFPSLVSAASALFFIFVAEIASAASIVINNGLAPPNPANVINAANNFPGQIVDVQNVGCNVNLIDPCPSPGAPTTVALVAGGSVSTLQAHETSSITMSGGTAGALATLESASATMSGGSVNDLDANGSSFITMSGGSLNGELGAFGTSSLTMTGGTAIGNIHAENSASMTIEAGAFGGSTISIGSLSNSASIKLSGGSGIGQVIAAAGSITIFGSNFQVGGVSVGFGLIPFQHGTLTGVLGSGDALDAVFSHDGYQGAANGLITLAPTPEPGTALLVASGLVVLAVRRLSVG